jgi:23S rRNA (uracil1939-C5)-methyltransferase
MLPKSSPETIETRIESLAAGGDGVGRTPDGRALFVPLTAPRDRVRVRIVDSRRRFARGVLEAVLEPSPDRVEPACSVFGRCGGCAWQHLDYAAQLSAKARILRDALTRIGRLEVGEEICVTPSPSAYGYRSRARPVQVGTAVGFRMRGSRRVCAVDACPVLQPAVEAALRRLVAEATSAKSSSAQGIEQEVEWELAAGTDGETRTTRVPAASRSTQPRESIHLTVAGDRLRISSGVFAQANALLLGKLADAVCREAGRGTTAVELFAGAGLLTLPLSRRFDCLWAIESDPRAIADLRFNLEVAGRPNVDVRRGRVERVLDRLGLHSPDALVLDPPRTGLPEPAFDSLLRIRPRRVVYLSCDPATLSRDLARLCDDGYRLAKIEAFDLFPQTPHVEALATLVPTHGEAA